MAALWELLKKQCYECINGTQEVKITDVIYDSRKVTVGGLFI